MAARSGLGRVRLLRPLRHRDFGLLWAGMSISILGDGFYQVALAWQVYELADTPTALSVVGAAVTLPHVLCVLLAGVVTDRFERRRVLLAADALRAVSVALIGGLAVVGRLQLWHVVALSAVSGIGEALFGPAFMALVPDLVPKGELPEANAVDQVVRPLGANLFGPALGGFVIAGVGAGPALLIDAASFGVSMAALLLLRAHPLVASGGARRGVAATFAEVAEGFGYVRRQTWLWGTLLASTVSLLCFMGPMRVLVPYMVKNRLDGSASDLGLVFAAGGVGSILASVAVSQRGLPRRAVVAMFVAWALAIYCIAGFGLVGTLWQAAVVGLVVGGLGTIGQVIWATLLGTRVPRDLLGRVASLDGLVSFGLVPVSYVATGPLATVLGVQQTLVLAGVLGGTTFASFLFIPGMREPERAFAEPSHG